MNVKSPLFRKCPKCPSWIPGRVNMGFHTVSESELIKRLTDKIPKKQFATIIQKIIKDLDKEHA